jgi:hypothetical protein
MNKENHAEKGLLTLPTGMVTQHIRAEISKQPKMKAQVAAHVARNLETLLNELKGNGVSMHAICSAAKLGNPNDRDAKALYKYRNPEGSALRKYISKAPLYARIAEAIADIKDHPYSDFTGELLRRVFEGTSYAPALTTSGDASIALKVILDEVTNWIGRHLNLAQTYERLQRMHPNNFSKPSASWQFELATEPLLGLPWHGCRLELGYKDVKVADDKGLPLILKSEENKLYDLCFREEVSLFLCMDDEAVLRPYLAFEQSLVAKSFPEARPISWVKDGASEGPEFGNLIFEAGLGKTFQLPKDTVARTVDLDALDQRLQDAYDRGEPEEADPVLEAFLEANFEYASHPFCRGFGSYAREIQTIQISADALEHLEEFLSEPEGTFSPANASTIPLIIRASGKPLLYGDGVLARLITCFTKSAWLMYEPDKIEKIFLGKDILESPMVPSDGWIGVDPRLNKWSAADILWLRCKMFVTGVESEFVGATRQQQAEYDALLQRLRNDGNSKV